MKPYNIFNWPFKDTALNSLLEGELELFPWPSCDVEALQGDDKS